MKLFGSLRWDGDSGRGGRSAGSAVGRLVTVLNEADDCVKLLKFADDTKGDLQSLVYRENISGEIFRC